MSVPTRAEEYAKLNEYLIKAQETAAMLAHLHNTEGSDTDKLFAKGWLGVAELLRQFQHRVTQLAMGRLN